MPQGNVAVPSKRHGKDHRVREGPVASRLIGRIVILGPTQEMQEAQAALRTHTTADIDGAHPVSAHRLSAERPERARVGGLERFRMRGKQWPLAPGGAPSPLLRPGAMVCPDPIATTSERQAY